MEHEIELQVSGHMVKWPFLDDFKWYLGWSKLKGMVWFTLSYWKLHIVTKRIELTLIGLISSCMRVVWPKFCFHFVSYHYRHFNKRWDMPILSYFYIFLLSLSLSNAIIRIYLEPIRMLFFLLFNIEEKITAKNKSTFNK